jgi:hypothetical protein
MTEPANHPVAARNQGAKPMEFLIPLSVLVVWIILQAWVLPRVGIKT